MSRIGRFVRVALALCFGASAHTAAAQLSTDSLGGRIVRYRATERAPRRWTLDPKPLLEIGGASAEGPAEFSEIRGATRLSDGRIAVANGATNEIRLFLSTGVFEHASGRSGGGPGEFIRLRRLFRISDTLVGVDGDSRTQFFASDGRLLRSPQAPHSAALRSLQRIGVLRDGSAITTGIEGSGRLAGNDSIEVMVVLRDDGGADSLSSLFRLQGLHTKRIGTTQGRVLLDAEGSAVARDPRVCAGYSAAFDVACYSASGSMIFRIIRETRSRSVTERDREVARAAFLDANRDAPPAIRQQMESAAKEFMFADRAPAFSHLMLSTNGELWVSQFDPATNLPGRSALLAPREPQQWNVFGTDGQWIAEVQLPARFVPYDMEREAVIGVSFDTDDVERITVFRIRR
ncbi:MAG: hypothetical protein ABI877_02380 [Gemmatimonadaceae bacterium]